MKNWQVVVIVIAVVIIGIGANVWYVRSATRNVTRHVHEISTEKEKALNQRLGAVEQSLSNSVSATASDTLQTVNGRLNEVDASLAAQIRSASSNASAETVVRLETLERSLNARLDGLGAPKVTVRIPGDLNAGLIAYYPFNGSANDESGNANNGTVNGATLTSDRLKNPNRAYKFYGSSASYIDVAPSASLYIPDDITISVWCRVDGDGTYGPRLISIDTANGANELVFLHETRGFAFQRETGPVPILDARWNGPIADGQWVHVVGVSTRTSISIYINGALAASGTGPALSSQGQTAHLNIGRLTHGGNDAFDGVIDEVRIYNRALSAQEVKKLYGLREPQ